MQLKLSSIFKILLLALISSCTSAPKKMELSPIKKSTIVPILLDFPQSGEVIDTSGQLESISIPLFSSGDDTLKFNSLKPFKRSFFYRDSVQYSESGNLRLIIDANQTFAAKYHEKRPWDYHLTYLDENGNEIPQKPYQPPYEDVTKFPVFIINSSDTIQALEHHDGRLVVIQEALTKDGKWKGIEYFEFSGCGNSVGINSIQPKEYVLFGVNKYAGDFKTKLRVRLRSRGKIFLSNEYSGSINEAQFNEFEDHRGFGWNRYLNFEKE